MAELAGGSTINGYPIVGKKANDNYVPKMSGNTIVNSSITDDGTTVRVSNPINSPVLTGTPTAPTAAVDTNTTQIATTAFVINQKYIDSIPFTTAGTGTAYTVTIPGVSVYEDGTLYPVRIHVASGNNATLNINGLGAKYLAINDSLTNVTGLNLFAGDVLLLFYDAASGLFKTANTRGTLPIFDAHMQGVPTVPTATAGTSSTQVASTAFVQAAIGSKANLASPTLTGTPTAPTAVVGTNTTQLATTAFVNSAMQGAAIYAVTSGTATAYSIAYSVPPVSLFSGLRLSFKAHVASGVSPTLNVTGASGALGAKSILKSNGAAAKLTLNGVYTVVYDGTAFILQGEGGDYGTATDSDVLEGTTVGTENGVISGTFVIPMVRAGLNWTPVYFNISSLSSICYGNGMFVAVSRFGVLRSSDGLTWYQVANITSNYWWSVCYGNGLFVAVTSQDFTKAVMTSPDGINWTQQNASAQAKAICFGNGIFVAVGVNDGKVLSSSDGVNWTSTSLPFYINCNSVCYGNGLFVAAGQNKYDGIMTSPDGINWTARGGSYTSLSGWNSICYGKGRFVLTGDSGGYILTSTDGITWTSLVVSQANNWISVCYGLQLFVAVARTGTGNRVMTSPDGLTWTIRSGIDDNNWTSLCFGGSRFIAVSESGTNKIAVSQNTYF